MNETSPMEEMKRYLYREMTDAESATLEDRLFEDDDYFYELAELENDLIDRYSRGKFTGADLQRFERSLPKVPERAAKVANARALQTLIVEEKPAAKIAAAVPTFGERIAAFFNLSPSSLRYAASALAILLICAVGFLIYQNRKAQNDYAEIEKRQEAERIEKENRLRQLEEEQKRVEQERRQLENNPPPVENGNVQLTNNTPPDKETERRNDIEKLRREIENDRRQPNRPPQNKLPPPGEYLAVLIAPVGRGGGAGSRATAELVGIAGKQQIKITQKLPEDKTYASFEIVADGAVVKTANIAGNAKSIEFTLPPNVREFEIKATERGTRSGSETLGEYELKLTKNK